MSEDIKHPQRYNRGGFECVDVIHAITYNLKGKEAWQIGEAAKYLFRFQEKQPIRSLEKAIECIQMEIDYIKAHPEQYPDADK